MDPLMVTSTDVTTNQKKKDATQRAYSAFNAWMSEGINGKHTIGRE